ncbi:hypothetical protein HMPREF9696_00605 [Afipia clevelandensis ATCC 49720]|uniref:Uncharacterized protein n=2 Tax=Afipia clevelandensis TaxID=1034 RepID=K8PSC8_9BRAD|nr:hypothetical protein HMPREF9696_00605 [Afipia clevelandensis ATCC 49720]
MSTMMVDEKLARIRARTSNIRRYRRLLKTELTELERSFVLKRLSEEERALRELTGETFPVAIGPLKPEGAFLTAS